MTPKEKAEELIVKFLPLLFGAKLLYKKSDYFKAKKCALIAVDEVIEECRVGMDWFWQEVKQEINLL